MTAIYDSANTTSSSTPPSLGLLDPTLDSDKQSSPIAVEKVEQDSNVSDSAQHRQSNRQDVRAESPSATTTGVVTEVNEKTPDQNSTANSNALRTDNSSGIQYQYATISQGGTVQVPSGFTVNDPGSTSPMPIRVVQVHAVEEASTAGAQNVNAGVGVAYSVGNGVQLINPGEGTGGVANVTVENPADGTRYTYYPAVQSTDSASQSNQLYVMMSPQDMIPVTGASTAAPRIIAPRAHPIPQISDGTTFAVDGDHTLQVEFRKVETSGSGRSSRDERRRATHNEVERRRRDKINNWIMKLASIVPECQVDQVKQGQVSSAQSKGGILSKTVDYITKLRSSNERMAESLKEHERVILENQFLRQQVEELRKENGVIRASMQLHMSEGNNGEGEQQVMETTS